MSSGLRATLSGNLVWLIEMVISAGSLDDRIMCCYIINSR